MGPINEIMKIFYTTEKPFLWTQSRDPIYTMKHE